jgi:hypothetical protein
MLLAEIISMAIAMTMRQNRLHCSPGLYFLSTIAIELAIDMVITTQSFSKSKHCTYFKFFLPLKANFLPLIGLILDKLTAKALTKHFFKLIVNLLYIIFQHLLFFGMLLA